MQALVGPIVNVLEKGVAWLKSTSADQTPHMKEILEKPLPEFRLVPETSYVPIGDVEHALKLAILHSCGVHLFPLPPNAGKTTSLTKVANEMLEKKKICGVVYVDLEASVATTDKPTVSSTFADVLGIKPDQLFKRLSDVRPKMDISASLEAKDKQVPPLLLIVDNADPLLANKKFRHDVVSLATNSVRTKDYVVLMAFRDMNVAQVVRTWNGSEKIHLLPADEAIRMQPTPEEIEAAVKAQALNLPKNTYEILVRQAQEAKSVGLVAEAGFLIRAKRELEITLSPQEMVDQGPQA